MFQLIAKGLRPGDQLFPSKDREVMKRRKNRELGVQRGNRSSSQHNIIGLPEWPTLILIVAKCPQMLYLQNYLLISRESGKQILQGDIHEL